jgi:hypothetical protein
MTRELPPDPCGSIRPHLIAFHFGIPASDGEANREAIEAHLLSCTACLRELFEVKRAIETAEDVPPPSEAIRIRLRVAVAAAVRPDAPPRRWWHRPLALAFAGSALIASMAATEMMTAAPSAPVPIPSIDDPP